MRFNLKIVYFLFVIVCKMHAIDWSSPDNLSAAGASASFPQITMDSSGNSIVVWNRVSGIYNIIQATYSSDYGQNWSTPTNLSVTGASATSSQVDMDNSGHAITVWQRSNGANIIIQGSYSSDYGQNWSAPANLSTAGQNAAHAAIQMNNSGMAIAVWRRSNGSNYIIQATYSSDYGQNWSVPANLSTAGQNADDPQIALDSSGNAIAVWQRSDGSNTIIQASYSSDYGQNWSASADLSTAGQDADSAQIALDNSGNAIVVWNRSDGSNTIIQASYSSDYGQNWSTPADLSTAGQDADTPQISKNSSGNAIVVWRRSNGSNTIVQTSYSSDYGQNWSTPANLSAAGQNASSPDLSLDSANNAIAVWRRSNGTNTIIQASLSLDNGQNWSTPVNLSATGENAANPHTVINDIGSGSHGISIWQRSDGSHNRIQAVYTVPPSSGPTVSGKQDKISFLFEVDIRNKITCNSMSQSGTFKIYRNAALTNLASSSSSIINENYYFYDHNVKHGETQTYYVTWTNVLGNESPASSLSIQ